MEKNNKPEKKFRCGGVGAAIWKNNTTIEGRQINTYSIQIQKRYKDKDDNWKDTNSFHTNDLPKVALAAQKSYEWITLKQDNNSDNQQPTETNQNIPEQKRD